MVYISKTIALILIFVQLSCSKKTTAPPAVPSFPPPVVVPPAPVGTAKTYLALGDSYTIGQGVATSENFPSQATDWLVTNGINISEPKIIATTGWTTTHLESAINSQNPKGPFDVVSLLIGVNDQYQQYNMSGYRERFTGLLQKAIQLAGNKSSHVFVLSIPDYSVTPFAQNADRSKIQKEINGFNEINKAVTLQHNCQYLDITASTRESINDPSLIAKDGLHPSGKEYKKWAERLGPLMKAVLQ